MLDSSSTRSLIQQAHWLSQPSANQTGQPLPRINAATKLSPSNGLTSTTQDEVRLKSVGSWGNDLLPRQGHAVISRVPRQWNADCEALASTCTCGRQFACTNRAEQQNKCSHVKDPTVAALSRCTTSYATTGMTSPCTTQRFTTNLPALQSVANPSSWSNTDPIRWWCYWGCWQHALCVEAALLPKRGTIQLPCCCVLLLLTCIRPQALLMCADVQHIL